MKKILPTHPVFSLQDFAAINSQWFHDLVSSFTSLSMGLELSGGSAQDDSLQNLIKESHQRLNYHIQCLRQLLIGKSSGSSLGVLKNYLETLGLTLWYAPNIQNASFPCMDNAASRDQIFLALGLWMSKKTHKQKGHIYVGADFITLWLEEAPWEEAFHEKKEQNKNRTTTPENTAFQKVPLKPFFVQQGEKDTLLMGRGKDDGERIGYGLYTHYLSASYGFSIDFCTMDSILSYICTALAYYEGLISRGFNKILSTKEQSYAWELAFWLLSRLNGVTPEEFQVFPLDYYNFFLEKIKDMDRGPCYLNFPTVSILTISLNTMGS